MMNHSTTLMPYLQFYDGRDNEIGDAYTPMVPRKTEWVIIDGDKRLVTRVVYDIDSMSVRVEVR